MKRAVVSISMALMLPFAATVAGAAGSGLAAKQKAWALSGDLFGQRKDVDEVTRPLPPSGPATPVPYCSPGSPVCP